MNIAINTRLLLPNRLEGIGRFTYEVTKRLVENHPEHTFFLFFDRKYDSSFVFGTNCIPVVLYPQARHPILYRIWFNYIIPRALKKYKIDLFFSPDGFLSLKTVVPQVPVIHDLNFEHIPEDLPGKDTRYYQEYFPKFARKAAHILTVSNFSKLDLEHTYQIASDKISVAYNGVDEAFHSITSKEKQEVLKQTTDGKPYFVYVGALHKRKNIARMLKAFDLWKSNEQNDYQLVIIGEKLFRSPEIDEAYNTMRHKEDVVFTGRLGDLNLNAVLAASEGLIYVSYFEGFGLPVLEAMKCGVPVLTSNVTSLPEVGGDLAIYCDPLKVGDITQGIENLHKHQAHRASLMQHAKKFTWDKTEAEVWKVLSSTS